MLERYNGRRKPFSPEADLPPLTADLTALTHQPVTEDDARHNPKNESVWAVKRRALAREFVGNSQLALLNGLLISLLRKSSAPDHAPALFQRLWNEQHTHLIDALDLRWKISSVNAFADHGVNDTQRQVGQALRMLFGVMKLYEFERLYSGVAPTKPFGFRRKSRRALPLSMGTYSLQNGGLDINILTPVWELALTDATMAPLVDHLMNRLNDDPATVFRRLSYMRQKIQDRS